jgi:anti-sigma regulatory factor (Ser/Thr protein kinase)
MAEEQQSLDSFSRSFVPDLDAPRAARRALQDLSGRVDEDLLERGVLVVTELVTNSVKHARLAPAQHIDVRISGGRDLLRAEVTDAGDGFEPKPTRPDPGRPESGWGYWIIDQLADRWGVDTSQSFWVWCEFEPGA